ncbi:NET1-associated nuclear protein 1 [Coniosporium apollinis]|uniref:NET1-associated nuclear protein 1 n=1 Tax=Coniosporium apollinis TaxID=61459 RepID=A0ABQ9NMU9_9PEZI|nr:NET1-associated nuclear protein 1 [Coniosporium apollinis]
MATAQPTVEKKRKREKEERASGAQKAKRVKSSAKKDADEPKENGAGERASAVANSSLVNGNDASMVDAQPVIVHQAPSLQKSHKKSKKSKRSPVSAWYTSQATGGRFLSADPVFSKDEKYIILAAPRTIHIYSAATSLLVRTLPIDGEGSISAYALSKSNADNVYVATSSGLIFLWDWVRGQQLQQWQTGSQIYGLVTATSESFQGEVVYTQERGSHSTITARLLHQGDKASESILLYKGKNMRPLQSFTVLAGGRVVVATASDTLIVGNVERPAISVLKDMTFTWREIKATESITCFDVQMRHQLPVQPTKAQRKALAQGTKQHVDIAIGCGDGAIYVYNDLLNQLIAAERPTKDSKSSALPTPRILHWHREPVGTLKWSLDGKYILSGGRETVLLLWQLDTGKRQELPHLTSAIENLTISPTGSSYAVQLADNSVIVLSTSELNAKTNIAGIQSRVLIPDETDTADHQAATSAKQKDAPTSVDAFSQVPCVINPLRPIQLLLAVPASQSRIEANQRSLAAPYLQAFDISSAHHVYRQALTRNNATIVNVGPNATKLIEPNVTHLQVSHDGKWLTTVEEWLPPKSDVEHLAADEQMAREEQSLRREIYLKFWAWNEEKEQWMLETRIDAPHVSPDGVLPGRLLDLIAEPNRVGFATVGEDGSVRMWKPKTRLRDGTVVRGSNAEGLVIWSSRFVVELEQGIDALDAEVDARTTSTTLAARLAFSSDGSVLTVAQERSHNGGQGLIHFIDTATGEIRQSRAGLYDGGLISLGFLDRYLIILSNDLTVWDIVDDELSYSISLSLPSITLAQRSAVAHLAVNLTDNTFAISLPDQVDGHGLRSKVFVFDPAQPQPIYSNRLPHIVTALLPAHRAKGYIALDAAAEIRIIGPRAAAAIPLIQPTAAPEQSLATVADEEAAEPAEAAGDDQDAGVEEAVADAAAAGDVPEEMAIDDADDDANPVVRPEQLAEIFDVGPSFALPPVKELFDAVVGLYARKPGHGGGRGFVTS